MFIIIYQIPIQNRDNIISSLNKPPVIARKIRLKGKQTSFDESDDARLDKLIEYQFDFEGVITNRICGILPDWTKVCLFLKTLPQ